MLENIQLPLTYQGTGDISPEAQERSVEVANLVGLGERLDHRPSQAFLAASNKRVAIARSLINDPYIILADEATGNLDTKTSEEIMDVLERLNDLGKDDHHGHPRRRHRGARQANHQDERRVDHR